MWHWIRRFRDWAMNEIVIPHRLASQPQSMYYSCEKAGLVLQNQPIPWGAESVLVEALIRPSANARKKTDYALRLPGCDPIPAESMRKDDNTEKYRLFFRFTPPATTTTGQLFWRNHPMGKVELPVLSPDEFARDLRIHLPTVFVQVGGCNVAAQTFVANQCKGLSATAIVRSSTGLAPLLDLELKAIFRWERSGRADEVHAPLVASQLTGKEALVSVSPPKLPRRSGEWTIAWMLGDRILSQQRVRTVSPTTFLQSLRIADARFIIEAEKGGMRFVRQLPPTNELSRAGPCFLVSSREPGMAGLVTFQVTAAVNGSVQSPLLLEQATLVTDGPTPVAPGLIDAVELGQISAFELRHKKRVLGCLALSPVPVATLTGEGGFKPATDFLWNNVAEEELLERLTKLMDVDRTK
jgi:hypothetical protein